MSDVAQTAEARGDVQDAGPRYQPLVIVLVAVASGILVDRYLPLSVGAWWMIAATLWLIWLVLWRGDRERLGSIALLVSIAATAGAWHHCRWYLFPENDLGYFAGADAGADAQPVCLDAVARKAPVQLPMLAYDPMRALPSRQRSRLAIEVASVRNGTTWQPVGGRTTLEVDGVLQGIHPGDRVRIFGQLAAPAPAQNPGEFDYAAYLRSQGCRSRLRTAFAECVSVAEPRSGWRPRELIASIRAYCAGVLRRHLEPQQAALASAVLLGARERLDPEQKQSFMETGTVHLLAISGLHVGILAGALMWVLLRLPIPRGTALLCVAGVTIFYMLLTDARPPVIRATILVVVMCMAMYAGRRTLGFNSLAAAGLIVLAWNPCDLFQVGAQLSFLAVAALVWFAPMWLPEGLPTDPLDRLIRENEPWTARTFRVGWLATRRLLLISTVIWLLALPLVMARFHLFTPVAMVLNTFLWVPITFSLFSGFATLTFGALFPPLGDLFGGLCNESLGFVQDTVEWVQTIPGSHFWVPGPANWWLIGFYGGLGALAAVPRLRPPRRWCVALLAGWVTVGFAAAWARNDSERLDCTFLSMGHGCATVLELPSGETLLYDAGRFAAPGAGSKAIAGYLWSRGITHLDAVVLSHGDIDHYNAVPELLERFSVGVVYVSPFMFEHPNQGLQALQKALATADVPIETIHAGDTLGAEGCRIEVLHPTERGSLGEDNANTIVLSVEHLGRRILLTGDLESPGINEFLAEEPVDYDVLQAPHHGSRQSNSPELAAWSTPEWVIISGSSRWDIEPVRETFDAIGGRVLHTAHVGAVHVRIDGNELSVEGFRPSRPQ